MTKTQKKILWVGAIGFAVREISLQLIELEQRRQLYRQARQYSDLVGKPLLVVGASKFSFNHPQGDVTIDLSPAMVAFAPNGIVADIRDIPFPSGHFGAVHCSHVLEHLDTPEDVVKALSEMHRVADRIFAVVPSKNSILAWFNPNHHLWVLPTGDGYIVEQRGAAKREVYLVSRT